MSPVDLIVYAITATFVAWLLFVLYVAVRGFQRMLRRLRGRLD